jgi:hypothetical protein
MTHSDKDQVQDQDKIKSKIKSNLLSSQYSRSTEIKIKFPTAVLKTHSSQNQVLSIPAPCLAQPYCHAHHFSLPILVWRFKAIIILQLRYNDILTVLILKIVSSYLLFVMSILISLCHNSERLVHNSDRCFIIRTVMSILWRSKAIIINRLIDEQ